MAGRVRLWRPQLFADWLIALGALGLLVSLFLPWSHQFTPALRSALGGQTAIGGVPSDPTGWQVYSIADVLLALLAAAIGWAALAGSKRARLGLLPFIAVAVAFTLHALSRPPTNGVLLRGTGATGYVHVLATSGLGEIVGIAAAGTAIAGVFVSAFLD